MGALAHFHIFVEHLIRWRVLRLREDRLLVKGKGCELCLYSVLRRRNFKGRREESLRLVDLVRMVVAQNLMCRLRRCLLILVQD
jgi:hypothetical protein